MSTRIDITVITRSLRQFAKDVMANNRRAQLEKEADRRTEAEAKRKREEKVAAEVPWPGAVPEGGIKPELAAYRGGKEGVAIAFVNIGLDGAPLDYLVYSGLQNASATGTRVELLYNGPRNYLGGLSWFGWYTQRIAGTIDETFLMPIDTERSILVTWQREQRRMEETKYTNVIVSEGGIERVDLILEYTIAGAEEMVESISCFYVDRKTVREITVPAAFKAALDAACPLGVYTPPVPPDPQDNSNVFPSGFYDWPAGPPFQPSLHFATRFRLDGWLPALTSDAGIYECLQDWDNAPRLGYDGTTVLNIRARLQIFFGAAPLPNTSFGYGKIAGTVTAERIGYDQNKAADVFPSVWKRFPKADIKTVFNGTSNPVGLYSSWCWGDPQYCRTQLLALGFTAADLRP